MVDNELDRWIAAARAALGLGDLDADSLAAERVAVLDLARDVAHGVTRPAAPLGAFLMGLAVGRGEEMSVIAAKLTELAHSWEAE